MGHQITISIAQGTTLLSLLFVPSFKIIAAIGEKKFSDDIASQCNRRMHLFFKRLKKESPILKEDDNIRFGPRDAYEQWDRKPTEKEINEGTSPTRQVKMYSLKDFKHAIDIDLTGKERDGLYWSLFLIAHPASQFCQGAAVQDSVVSPLIEQIKMVGQLEADTGIAKNTVNELEDDDTREAGEKGKADAAKAKVPALALVEPSAKLAVQYLVVRSPFISPRESQDR